MPTGERASYHSPAWAATAARHRAAYCFVRGLVGGLQVVEIGCGTGYGAGILGEVAAHVTAIDNSEEAIASARKLVRRDNVTFRVGDALQLRPEQLQCDVLVALQVIEHLPDPPVFLAMAAQATRPQGLCILSTPNAVFSAGENPYHAREYVVREFERLLSQFFATVDMRGVFGSERALSYDSRRRRLARAVLRADFLRLRRLIPLRWQRRVGDVVGEAIKMYLGGADSSDSSSWDQEFEVAQGEPSEALDLLAVCSHAGSTEGEPASASTRLGD